MMHHAPNSPNPATFRALDLVFNPSADFKHTYEQTQSSSIIRHGILPLLKDILIELALDESNVPSWESAQTLLRQRCRELGQTALEAALRKEFADFDFLPTQRVSLAPLCLALGVQTEADIPSAVANAHIPGHYLAEVAAALPKCEGPFAALRHMCEKPAVRDLVQGVFHQMRREKPNLDVVHRLVTDARYSGEDLALSSQGQAGLMCFPYLTRIAVQDLLVGSSRRARLTQSLDVAEREFPETKALDTVVATYFVANSHWDSLVRHHTPSEDTIAAIARDAVDKIYALREAYTLQSEWGQKLITRFLDCCRLAREELSQKIEALPEFSFWRQIDIGHFSSVEYADTLNRIAKGDGHRVISPVKCGEFAAVLEDDPEQLARYVATVNDCSKFSLLPDGASACATPGELLKLIHDHRVTYFVLDIENGEHRHAGITTAITLLEESFRSTPDLAHSERPLTLVIWSMSLDRVNEATEAIQSFLETKPWKPRVNTIFPTGGQSSNLNRVSVEAKLKTGNLFEFF